MPRYEFSEGSSNKFWEIKIEGSSVITTYGRIGADGQSTVKDYNTAEQAQKEYDKLVASKTKKGYKAVGGGASATKKAAPKAAGAKPAAKKTGKAGAAPAAGGAPAAREARNPDLEKAILEDLADDAAYLVYADWLQSKGDPRGELITIQHALSKKSDKKLKKAEAVLLEKHGAYFVPPKLDEALRFKVEKGWKKDESHRCQVTWRNGFMRIARLARSGEDDPHKLDVLATELFAHPSARFLEELQIGALGIYDEYYFGHVVEALIKAKPQSLRKLFLADFWTEDSELSWSQLGSLGKLWAVVPRLEELTLRGGSMDIGKINLPRLRSLHIITGGLDSSSLKAVTRATWPSLESLQIYLGTDDYGGNCTLKHLTPIFDAQGLPKLKQLGLMNCEFTDEICRALPASRVLKQLSALNLGLGTLSDDGAATIVEHKQAFKHLKELNLEESFLTKKGIAAVKGLCAKVVTGKQKEPHDWDEDGRYVSVGE